MYEILSDCTCMYVSSVFPENAPMLFNIKIILHIYRQHGRLALFYGTGYEWPFLAECAVKKSFIHSLVVMFLM